MTVTRLNTLETVCKALADSTRLRILNLLRAGEVCVCEIHESLKLPQSKVSRHLAYLRATEMVTARKDGLWVHYRLARWSDPAVQQLVDSAVHAVTHVPEADRDVRRMAKVTCCQVPGQSDTSFACCAGDTAGAR
jgi:ArsR family transcriptional regulator